MFDKLLENFLLPLLVVGVAGVIGAACVRFILPLRVRVWEWRTWILHFRCGFFFRQQRSRRNARIICLEEYVEELERARNKLAAFARAVGTKKCEIVVRVFTMQLPSDWPLWFRGATDRKTLGTTPLGRYILGFKDFVAGAETYEGIQVNVTRCIVIDNCGSPTQAGEARLKQLKEDVSADWYDSYRKLLHGGDDNHAFYLRYERPWPGWLADSVFFGIRMKDDVRGDGPPKWLWGFTTSYNPGEDVLIYRYHYLRQPGPTPKDLPEGVSSISEMPTDPGLTEAMKPLSSLLTGNGAAKAEN
jgi:hypothetical protein